MTPTWALLFQATLLALGVLLALGLAAGLAVALRPATLEYLRSGTDRRFSMRRATRPLDIPRNVDALFYRHHRIYGTAVVVLSLFLLVFLSFGQVPAADAFVSDPRYLRIGDLLVETARVVLWGLALFAFAVGVVVFVRPSGLKRLESWANRWVTPRRQLKGLEREYHALDSWAAKNPRAWGVSVAVATALCLLALILHAPAIARLGG